MLDITTIREQFPALQQTVNQQPLIYLDSAATTQKPQCVIDVISHYYSQQNANVHRGSHSLTAHATSQFEAARETVAKFIGAQSKEIIWTRGATEASTLSPKLMLEALCSQAMRFLSVKWSTTQILCLGKLLHSKPELL